MASQAKNRQKKENQKARKQQLVLNSQSELDKLRSEWPAGKGAHEFVRVGRQDPFTAFYGISANDMQTGGYLLAGNGGTKTKITGK